MFITSRSGYFSSICVLGVVGDCGISRSYSLAFDTVTMVTIIIKQYVSLRNWH